MPTRKEREGYQIGRLVIGKRKAFWWWLCLDCSSGSGYEWEEDACRVGMEHRRARCIPGAQNRSEGVKDQEGEQAEMMLREAGLLGGQP